MKNQFSQKTQCKILDHVNRSFSMQTGGMWCEMILALSVLQKSRLFLELRASQSGDAND